MRPAHLHALTWEQRRLGDEFEFLRNNTLSRAELSDSEGSCFDVHYGDVLIKFGSVIDLEKMALPRVASDKMASRLTCDKLRNGDVVVADTAEDEAAGKCVELRKIGDATVYPGLHTMPLRPLRRYAPGFLGHYLNSSSFRDQLKPLMQGIKVISVSRAVIAGTSLIVPAIDEQDAIAKTFAKLDSLIALHQRELDHVKELKKGLLQKMFPKEGTNAPELRFPGFTNPWEQRRLGEVVDVHDGVHQTPDYKDHGVMFVSVEDIETLKSEKYISKEDYDRDYKTRPATGDILMTRIGDVGTSNVVETHDEMAFYVSLALLKPRNIESYFLNSAIKSSFFQKRLQERTLVTAVPKKINKDEIGKVEILLPVAIEEQRQIGAFFRSLDSLIALHQRERAGV